MLMVNELIGFAAQPRVLTAQVIPGATGTNIGDMTAGGGLAAAFNGNTNQAETACANKAGVASGAYAYVGKDYGAGTEKIIQQARTWPSNDWGYNGNEATVGTPTITLSMYAKNSAPANATDGTLLATTTRGDSQTGPDTLTSTDQVTAWRYVWIAITHNGTTNAVDCAEVEFTELA
jgi:hypothetical protein